MDYERLASELLRELRGKRSQAALMRRLGYSANAPYSWEAGRRFPPAQVLFELGLLNGCELPALRAFAGLSHAGRKAEWSAGDTAEWLGRLLGETPASEVARVVGADRTTVSRWLHGQTEPRVPQLLQLVDRLTHRLVELVRLFVEPARLPSLRAVAQELAAQLRIGYEVPWSHALLRALELSTYRSLPAHVPGVLARAIGLTVADEEELLSELRAARLIHKRRGKWQPSRVLTVDTSARPERDRLLKLHWARVGVSRLEPGPIRPDTLYSFNLCAVSHEDLARIRELHLEYYERVRRIVAESKVADRVLLLNQQLIPLDEREASGEPVVNHPRR